MDIATIKDRFPVRNQIEFQQRLDLVVRYQEQAELTQTILLKEGLYDE